MKTAFAMASLAVALVAPTALADAQDARWTIASPGRQVVVDLKTGAGLSISAWDRDEVAVESDWTEERCRDARMDVTRTDAGVRIESSYPDRQEWVQHHCSFGITVRVPRRSDVRIRSAGGRVAILGVEGVFTGRTGGGMIELKNLRGRVELATGGGQILVRDSELDGSVRTGGGRVRFENVSGGIVGRSGSMRRAVRARQYSI